MYNVLTRNVVTRRSKPIEGDIGTMRSRLDENEGNVSTTRVYPVR